MKSVPIINYAIFGGQICQTLIAENWQTWASLLNFSVIKSFHLVFAVLMFMLIYLSLCDFLSSGFRPFLLLWLFSYWFSHCLFWWSTIISVFCLMFVLPSVLSAYLQRRPPIRVRILSVVKQNTAGHAVSKWQNT